MTHASSEEVNAVTLSKKHAAYLFAPVLAATAVVGLSGPTAAQDMRAPDRACPAGALCVYRDSSFHGPQYEFYGDNWSWHQWAIADDDSSSWNNGTGGLSVSIYRDTGYAGDRIVCLPRGTWTAHHDPNDAGSSNVWVNSC
jgi:hypothetical protein